MAILHDHVIFYFCARIKIWRMETKDYFYIFISYKKEVNAPTLFFFLTFQYIILLYFGFRRDICLYFGILFRTGFRFMYKSSSLSFVIIVIITLSLIPTSKILIIIIVFYLQYLLYIIW